MIICYPKLKKTQMKYKVDILHLNLIMKLAKLKASLLRNFL